MNLLLPRHSIVTTHSEISTWVIMRYGDDDDGGDGDVLTNYDSVA